MSQPRTLYRVHRRRWQMLPALVLGIVQVAAGLDTLFFHLVLPAGRTPVTNIAAGLLILLGLALILLVLANLLVTPPLIEARADGLFLGIAPPGEPPVHIPWDALKSVELGHAGLKKAKEDPLCLIIRFVSSRVRRPDKLSVFHSTKSAFYLRGSQLPALDPLVERLNALRRERQGGAPAQESPADEDGAPA